MAFYQGTNKKDNLKGTAKKDTINGKGGNDKIDGRGGNDKLNGGAGKDTLNGGAGKDTLNGGGGNDQINGGGSNDKLNGGAGKDTLNGSGGNDQINGGGSNDKLNGGAGKDTLNGGNAQDNLIGGSGNDFLDGGNGNDVLTGNDGNDVLVGNFGKDILTGGAGDDVFFLKQNSAVNNNSAADMITDFQPNFDTIGLDSGLTENDLNLQLSGNSTVIKIKKTGKILGVVQGVQPQELKWNFTSVDGKPNVIENLVTFDAPTVEQKSSDTYEMKLTGSDKSDFVINIKKTDTGTHQESLRYTPSPSEQRKGNKPFTAKVNSEGTRIELQFDDSPTVYIFDNQRDENTVDLIKKTATGETKIAEVPVDLEMKSNIEQSISQGTLCEAGQNICKSVEILDNVASGLAAVTALTGVGTVASGPLGAVALGAKVFGYGCLVLYGDDTDLVNNLIGEVAGNVFSQIGSKLFKAVASPTRKLVSKIIGNKYDQEIFKPLGDESFKQMEDFYLGKKGEELGKNTYDFIASILKTSEVITNKNQNSKSSDGLMQKIREGLGINWCNEKDEKDEKDEKKEVRVYFQPQGNPWAISKLYLVSPEEKFIGTAPNSFVSVNNDAFKWKSIGTFPIGTELEFETRVEGPLELSGSTNLVGGLTLSSKASEAASIKTNFLGMNLLGFEDGSSGKLLGVEVEKPNDFNDTLVKIENIIFEGNNIFVG
ncbi:Hemolysin-type calcium-binding region [Trichodesmium erythraeum IMS101]|uniref:Hemolysin-type calcium-binding region n=1 Tax=Trichodesmium erythraeum (strain IMS101) TaxID=203124 RepID=Q119F4_TRIEI|nr:calcium-binding protein [Trichodesmium erythraeum GBRTRLIN201]